MCKQIHTAVDVGGIRPTELNRTEFEACFIPSYFTLMQFDGDQTTGPDSVLQADFGFGSEDSTDALDFSCDEVNSAVDGILAVLFALLAFVPDGGAAAGEIGGAVKQGVSNARKIGTRAAEVGESIKFGCKSIEDLKDAANSARDLVTGATPVTDVLEQMAQAFIDGNNPDNELSGIDRITKYWDGMKAAFPS